MPPFKNKAQKQNNKDDDYIIYTQTNRSRKIGKKYVKVGSWTSRENQIYADFLQAHSEMFQTEFARRSTKVFRKISSLLRRRDPQQCRSHHQKFIIKYNGNIETILSKLRVKIKKSEAKMMANKHKVLKKEKEQNLVCSFNLCQKQLQEGVFSRDMQKQIPTGDRSCNYINELQIIQHESGDVQIKLDLSFGQTW